MSNLKCAILFVFCLLIGCGLQGETRRADVTVSGLSHRPMWIQQSYIYVWNGKSMTMIPQTVIHPEAWIVEMKDSQGNQYRGEVGERFHNSTDIGDRFRITYNRLGISEWEKL